MTTKDEALQMALDALEGMSADLGKFPNEVPAIAACREALAQQNNQTITEHAAHKMGETGGEPSDCERLLFESWMRGHNWHVVGQWDGTTYVHEYEGTGFVHGPAVETRRLWAAWRDRAALAQSDEQFCDTHCTGRDHHPDCTLAQNDEQEPIGEARAYESTTRYTHCIWDANVVPVGTKLYTTPPKRQPLTEEEIIRIMQDEINVNYNCWADHIEFARAIEKAHGIGENT
jgi:hypothetical protein